MQRLRWSLRPTITAYVAAIGWTYRAIGPRYLVEVIVSRVSPDRFSICCKAQFLESPEVGWITLSEHQSLRQAKRACGTHFHATSGKEANAEEGHRVP